MCTLILLRRPAHDWPLIIAAKRNENIDRPMRSPGRHWPDRDHVTAVQDKLARGSWFGVNDYGLAAGILNRSSTLEPNPGLRSRGELTLEALDHAEAKAVAKAFLELNPNAYGPFNLFVGDAKDSFWISSQNESGEPSMHLTNIPEGVSMLTDKNLNDISSPRIKFYLPRFVKAQSPNPLRDDWTAWQKLLAEKGLEDGTPQSETMMIPPNDGSGIVSSSLLALPCAKFPPLKPCWLFAAGVLNQTIFEPVQL